MKSALILSLVIITIAIVPNLLVAQDQSIDSDIQMLRADIRADKTKLLTEQLNLSDDESKKFWPIYRDYDNELSKLNDQKIELLKEYAANYDTMTNERTKSMAERSFALEKKRIDLQKQYFDKISKAVTPKTAARFLQVENRVDLLLRLQLAANVPMLPNK